MLIGINPIVGPCLLDALYRMGHGDEIVLADAFFPGTSFNSRVIWANGVRIPELLDSILALINLDCYVPKPVLMMLTAPGDNPDPVVEKSYRDIIEQRWPGTPAPEFVERFCFYERAKKAYAVVMTGDMTKYGNIILRKGVLPVSH